MVGVEIKGFQSIDRVSFTLDGFTAFIGRSNIGKSAVVRAIHCALTGASGTDFVRHTVDCARRIKGSKKCKCQSSVKIELPDITFLWEKGDAINQYTVWEGEAEPKVYSKVDRGTPDFLIPYFSPIRVGKSDDVIQVSEQIRPMFLIDQSGNTVADVLSDVAQLDQINTAIGLVSKDRKRDLSTRRVRDKDLESIDGSLEKYEGLDRALDSVRDLEKHYGVLETSRDRVGLINKYIESIRRISTRVESLESATSPSMPDLSRLSDLNQRFEGLSRFYHEVAIKAKEVRRLKAVDQTTLPEESPLESTFRKLIRFDGWLTRLKVIKVALESKKALESLPDLNGDPLTMALDRLSRVGGYAERWSDLESVVKDLTTQMEGLDSELEVITGEFDEIGVCPTCYKPMDPESHVHLGDS